MKCYLCNRKNVLVFKNKVDKYQKLIGIDNGLRSWYKCTSCDLYQQSNGLTDIELSQIYTRYRDPSIRKRSIKDSFYNIINLQDSENSYRIKWLAQRLNNPKTILDIGSGLGVFPFSIKKNFVKSNIESIEINENSRSFINDSLQIKCYADCSVCTKKYKLVTCVHVLEHIKNPDDFLQYIKKKMTKNGLFFIEIPDSIEFKYLKKDHDEFSSLHLFFYSDTSITKILKNNSLNVIDLHKCFYKKRNLSRILIFGQNGS